jgi:C4-dicarboxylate transporter DctM subunit
VVWLVFVLLFVFLYLGFPIAFSLGISSSIILYYFTTIPLTAIPQKIFTNLDSFPLMAVPFFLLASNIFAAGGVSQRLIRLANAWFGHLDGGLAIAGIAACALFAAVSGSSPATVAAIGSIMIPAMIKHGYDRNFAVGSQATAGSLGIMIPPSIPLILYGFVTEESVGKLFIAGILPGLLLAFNLAVISYIVARIRRFPKLPPASWGERFRATAEALPSLTLPAIIIGGIYGGVFTPTEAAGVAVVVGIVVGMFVHRELKPRDFVDIFIRTGRQMAMLMFIITMAQLFAFLLTVDQLPKKISQAVLAGNLEAWQVLLIINIILLIAGDFLDPAPIILVMAPIFHEVATAVGIDPIHLGIVITMNMEAGMITPPVGLNLYVASGITKMPLYDVMKAAAPWILVVVFTLLIVTYVPQISLFLPNLLYR